MLNIKDADTEGYVCINQTILDINDGTIVTPEKFCINKTMLEYKIKKKES